MKKRSLKMSFCKKVDEIIQGIKSTFSPLYPTCFRSFFNSKIRGNCMDCPAAFDCIIKSKEILDRERIASEISRIRHAKSIKIMVKNEHSDKQTDRQNGTLSISGQTDRHN